MEPALTMMSMFPHSLTVCETSPDGVCSTETHFFEEGEVSDDQALSLGIQWYHTLRGVEC